MEDKLAENHFAYNYLDPLDLGSMAGGDSLFLKLVDTPAFQRLKYIRFLGAIDYALVPAPNGHKGNSRYTRYQHSLEVARLALLYARERGIAFPDHRPLYVAALLHDIGHAPLSHSLEPVFQELFGLEHHRVTQDIITNRVPIGAALYKLLREYGMDIDRIVELICGNDPSFDDFFAGPINFDTIEGILRSQTYIKPKRISISPERVTIAALWRSNNDDRDIVDEFLSYKDRIYRYVINSQIGVLADYACQHYMRRHLVHISPKDYFATEGQLFRKMPGLRELLKSPSFSTSMLKLIDRPIAFTARKFYIDPNCDFFSRDDRGRYR